MARRSRGLTSLCPPHVDVKQKERYTFILRAPCDILLRFVYFVLPTKESSRRIYTTGYERMDETSNEASLLNVIT